MASSWVMAYGLFERQVLLAAPNVQVAHRCIHIRPMQKGTAGDSKRRLHRGGNRRIPTSVLKCRNQIAFGGNNRDVNRVARDAGAGTSDRGCHVEPGMDLVARPDFPRRRRNEISDEEI